MLQLIWLSSSEEEHCTHTAEVQISKFWRATVTLFEGYQKTVCETVHTGSNPVRHTSTQKEEIEWLYTDLIF